MALPRITVLTSGRGSNLRAMLAAEREGRLDGAIATVIANRPGIPALDVAATHGVPGVVVPAPEGEDSTNIRPRRSTPSMPCP